MGDMVERALEETIPILRCAKKSKLLSAAEVSEVVRQRRDHEYRLRGCDVPRAAFLEYAAFEKELASLLSTRAKARNLKRSRVEQVVGATASRANLVYSRAVKRFKGDVDLWLYYARHCVDSGSKRAAAKVFARAIAMRPDAPEVWLATIAFHFDTCGDVTIARKIAQRALRAIPDAKQIWLEYFRMELAFLAKVVARRIAIRIPVPKADEKGSDKEGEKQKGQGNEKVDAHMTVDEIGETETNASEGPKAIETPDGSEASKSGEDEDGEPNSESESEGAELPQNSLTFWQGGVPLAVFRQAKRSVAMDVANLLEYWKITAHMAHAPPMLVRTIASDIDSCTANVTAVAAMLVRLDYDVALAQLRHTLPPKVIGLETRGEPASVEQDTSAYDAAVADVKVEAPKACTVLCNLLRDAAPPTDAQTKLLLDVAGSFVQAADKYLDSELMETLRDELSALRRRRDQQSAGPDMSKMTLSQVAQNGSYSAWAALLNASKGSTAKRKDEIRQALKNCVAIPFRNKEKDKIAAFWVSWEDTYVKTIEAVRVLTAVPPSSKLVLESAIEAMKAYLSKNGGEQDRREVTSTLRELYVKVTGLKASENDVDLWIDYSEFERVVCGNAEKSSAVVWKARKILSASDAELFTEKLCLRTLAQ